MEDNTQQMTEDVDQLRAQRDQMAKTLQLLLAFTATKLNGVEFVRLCRELGLNPGSVA